MKIIRFILITTISIFIFSCEKSDNSISKIVIELNNNKIDVLDAIIKVDSLNLIEDELSYNEKANLSFYYLYAKDDFKKAFELINEAISINENLNYVLYKLDILNDSKSTTIKEYWSSIKIKFGSYDIIKLFEVKYSSYDKKEKLNKYLEIIAEKNYIRYESEDLFLNMENEIRVQILRLFNSHYLEISNLNISNIDFNQFTKSIKLIREFSRVITIVGTKNDADRFCNLVEISNKEIAHQMRQSFYKYFN